MPIEDSREGQEYESSYDTEESCRFSLGLIESLIGNGDSGGRRIHLHLHFDVINYINNGSILRISGYYDASSPIIVRYNISRLGHFQICYAAQ